MKYDVINVFSAREKKIEFYNSINSIVKVRKIRTRTRKREENKRKCGKKNKTKFHQIKNVCIKQKRKREKCRIPKFLSKKIVIFRK